jgi:gluconate 2-dehydrogenase gamma chain
MGVSRREVLQGTGALAAATLASACGSSSPPGAALPAGPLPQLPVFAFSDTQRTALAAATARLVPADGVGDWSATDAGAVEYIEQLLNAFSAPGNPKVFGGGPVRSGFARFHALPRVKVLSWQREVLRLRALYVAGLDELNRLARGPLSLLPGDFAAQATLAQDAILESQDLQATEFFGVLFEHTMEAVYAHPVYGGNRGYVGWQSVGYQGDVHGVRFPGGHDPAADAEPWRKFGGYSADEIQQPGLGEGPVT